MLLTVCCTVVIMHDPVDRPLFMLSILLCYIEL